MAKQSNRAPRNQAPVWAGFLIAYLLIVAAALISALIDLWPLVHSKPLTSGKVDFLWGAFTISISPDTGLIVLAAVLGGLGAFIHAGTSLTDFLGNHRFVASWTPWYVLRLPIGAALAVILYFVVRAGFLSTNGTAEDVNAFGVAALGGMAGLFSKQATDKLREVFETLFKVAADRGDAERGDSLANPAPVVKAIDPVKVKARSADFSLRVSGQGFVEHSVVRVNGAEQRTNFQSAGELTATVEAKLLAEPALLDVTVANPEPGGGVSEALVLTVKQP